MLLEPSAAEWHKWGPVQLSLGYHRLMLQCRLFSSIWESNLCNLGYSIVLHFKAVANERLRARQAYARYSDHRERTWLLRERR